MLTIRVSGVESFDDSSGEFTTEGGTLLELEHSLVSLSKWESIHEKPFLGNESKSAEELISYVKCMLVTSEVPEDIFQKLSIANFEEIHKYIDAKMTATWFSEQPGTPKTSEIITSEVVYYWMTVFNIPFECEHWHLNRLFTLIRICNIKQAKPQKMSRSEIAARNRALNAQRKAQLGTSG
jgi:hypothetical protein